MKKVLSLVLLMLILMSSLVSCYIPIREANINDIYTEGNRTWSSDKKSCTYDLKLQVNEKIKDLVLQINLTTEDDKVIKTITLNVGRVVPGNEYTYRLDVSDMTLEEHNAVARYITRVVDGYVVIP